MVANTTPIFPLTPKVSWGKVLTANTNMDGTGAVTLIFTAGGSGSRVDEIRAKGIGSNVQTALRIFVNNGQSYTTTANNSLIYDKTIAATTASNNSELAELVIWPDTLVLPAAYTLYAAVGTVITAGIMVTVIGGDY